MTESEALGFINERIDILKEIFQSDNIDYQKALEVSAKALEKQIAKKPNIWESCYACCCSCKRRIVRDNNYCCYCGQKIDWSE